MTQARSLAVAQTCPVKGDVPTNVAEHLRLARSAADEGARVILFPELSLTGYEPEAARDLAFTEDDRRLAPLIDASASLSALLVVGAPVRLGRRLCIGAFVLRPDRTVTLCTKHHLGAFPASAAAGGTVPPAEATVFSPGDDDPVVVDGANTAAIAICKDIAQPSHPRRAAERGARLYLASMFVIPRDFTDDAAKLASYAARHRMTVALANFGDATGGLAAAGRSSIWSDTGELLVQLDAGGAGVAVAVENDGTWRARAIMAARNDPIRTA